MALKKLIAITQIVMGLTPGVSPDPKTGLGGVKPKTKTIPKDTFFKAADIEQQKELIGLEAARVATKEDEARLLGARAKDLTDDDDDDDDDDDSGSGDGKSGDGESGDGGNGGGGNGDDDLDALRKEYEAVVGKKPGKRGADKMKAEIAEAKKSADDGTDLV